VDAALQELGIDRKIPVSLGYPANPGLWFQYETQFRGTALLSFRVPADASGNVLIIDRSTFPDM